MRWYIALLLFTSTMLLCKGQQDYQPDDNHHHDDDHAGHDDDHANHDDDHANHDDDHAGHDDDHAGHDDDHAGHDDDHAGHDDDHGGHDDDHDRHDDDGDHHDHDHGRRGCSNVHLKGSQHVGKIGHIVSPNFPNNYPTEKFECSYHIENEAGGHVRLVFDDFMLARWDVIKIWYGKERSDRDNHKETFYGKRRPYPIVSKGRSIWIEFNSDQCRRTSTGFKATYEFVDSEKWEDKPLVRQSVRSHPSSKFYAVNLLHFPKHVDHVWILKGFENHRVLVGIQQMFIHGNTGDCLEIRDGPTSEGALLASWDSTRQLPDARHCSSRSDTVYVRLRGEMYHHDKLVGTFVAATDSDNAGNCPDGYFRCNHGNCIVSNVVCDGFDHCGDRSDEHNCHMTPTISYPEPHPGDPFDCTKCKNGATCVPELHMCSCPIGYYGSYCEYPDERLRCEDCQNGATCTVYDNGNVGCVCQPGYYGDHCEHYEGRHCEGCENGGTCTDPYDGECICPEGYYGLRCEYEEAEYECGGGCLHGGDCVYGDCQCRYGYYGERCEYIADPFKPAPYKEELNGWVIAMIIFGSVIAILLVVVVSCCICSRCSKTAPSQAKKVQPYSVSAEVKYSVSAPPPSYDNCHDNPTYVTVNDGADNVSLPPAYDEVNRYSNNPYLAEGTVKGNETELEGNGKKVVQEDATKSKA
ncbi:uncharacterized protein [Ptychodera flava]|uniref:uncharacterized protein isoform X2 n=1 Tax=Ptychodera flava TaxID=63121 RepID=UPI003969EE21